MSAPALPVEDVVAKVLSFAAADEDRLSRFLDWLGLEPSTIREAAKAPGFGPAVLDYAASDARFLEVFTFATGIDANDLWRARARLQAGPAPKVKLRAAPEPVGPSGIARRFRVIETESRSRG